MSGNTVVVTAAVIALFSGVCQAVDVRLYSIADGSADARGTTEGTTRMLWMEDPAVLGTAARRSLLKFDTSHIGPNQLRGATLNLFGGRTSSGGVPTLNIYHYADDSWTESRIPYPSSLGNHLLSTQVTTVLASGPYNYAQLSFGIGYNLPENDDNGLLSIALVASGGSAGFNSRNTVNWDGSLGNEPFIDFRTWGMTTLANSSFDGQLSDWVVKTGGGTVTVVEHPRQLGNMVAQMTAGSPVSLTQRLDTPQDSFYVLLDYEFVTNAGNLELTLTDRDGATTVIGQLEAPASPVGSMSSAVFHVTDPSLLYLDHVEFGIKLDGLSGSQVLLDNIRFSAIPELPRLSIRVSQQVELCWQTSPNAWYQLQYCSLLPTGQWLPLSTNWVTGDGTRFCTTDAVIPGNHQRFYRLSVANSPPQ